MDRGFLDWALEAFSGYVAVDELYEGPYCVLSAVNNRQYKRILYEVLDHDPSHDDMEPFLRRLKRVLDERELTLQGITTDGSSPISRWCGRRGKITMSALPRRWSRNFPPSSRRNRSG